MEVTHRLRGDDKGALRILLIEDHQETAVAMKRLLELEGYMVTIAQTRADAIHAAGSGTFDVVITDLILPDGEGAEIVSMVRNLSGPMPAIAVTGMATVDMAATARRMGFADYLMKPIHLDDLRLSIDTCTRRLN